MTGLRSGNIDDNFLFYFYPCLFWRKKKTKKYARSREGKKAKLLFEHDISGHRLLAANVEVCMLATLKFSISFTLKICCSNGGHI